MCKEVENIEEIKNEELNNAQVAMDFIALEEEIKRVEKQEKEFKVAKNYKNAEVVVKAEEEAYAVASAFRILLEAGVDYNYALAVASNSITNHNNILISNINATASITNQTQNSI